MKFKLIILLIITLTSVFYFSPAKCEQVQQKSFQYYDSLTYQQYLSGSWNDLIGSGKQALASGYDYKNLRLRLGFAYFFKENYRIAADHFHKALAFDSYDTVAALYFNLSCQAAGRTNEIYHVRGTKKPYRMLDFIYADAGTMLAGKVNNNASFSDSSNYYKELIQPVSRTYGSLGLNLRPLPGLSVFVGYSLIKLTDKKSYGYLSVDAVRDSVIDRQFEKDYYYSFPPVKSFAEQEFNNQQSSLYLNVTYFPVPGLKVTPAFHYLRINAARVYALPTSTARSDTAWYNKTDSTWHTFNYTAYNYQISRSDTSYADFVISLAVDKEIGKFSAGISGTYARMLEKKIYQIGASLSWYPFGNTDLYAHSSFTYQNDKATTTTVFEQMAGGRLYKYGWLEGFYTWGQLKNYNEKNAYLVYNQLYPVKMRCGITFYPYIGKHLELMVMYRYQKIGLFLTSASFAESSPVVSNPDYAYSTLTSGVKWKF